jgi:hypothetical protein
MECGFTIEVDPEKWNKLSRGEMNKIARVLDTPYSSVGATGKSMIIGMVGMDEPTTRNNLKEYLEKKVARLPERHDKLITEIVIGKQPPTLVGGFQQQ